MRAASLRGRSVSSSCWERGYEEEEGRDKRKVDVQRARRFMIILLESGKCT